MQHKFFSKALKVLVLIVLMTLTFQAVGSVYAQTDPRYDRLEKLDAIYRSSGYDTWFKAVGFTGTAVADARQPEEETMADGRVFVSGMQVKATNLVAPYPACFTTDHTVLTTAETRTYKPDQRNGTALWTNNAAYTGTATIYADCSNWAQLSPEGSQPPAGAATPIPTLGATPLPTQVPQTLPTTQPGVITQPGKLTVTVPNYWDLIIPRWMQTGGTILGIVLFFFTLGVFIVMTIWTFFVFKNRAGWLLGVIAALIALVVMLGIPCIGVLVVATANFLVSRLLPSTHNIWDRLRTA